MFCLFCSILRGIPTKFNILHFHFLIQSFIPLLTEVNWNQYEHNSGQSSFLLTSNGCLFTTTQGLLIYHTPAFLNDHLFPLLHRGQAMIFVTTLALFSVLTGSHRVLSDEVLWVHTGTHFNKCSEKHGGFKW